MTADEALKILDRFLQLDRLNNLQELIFRQSWQNQTYQKIAANSGYSDDYIREQGGKLWQLLSQILQEKINKKNFKAVLKKQFRQEKTAIINDHRDWEEAIDVSLFYGRSEELTTLEQWIVGDKCRQVGIFGIGGIGKTSLAVKLTQQVASNFDIIVWRSLRTAPPINDLLADIIQSLSQQQEIEQNLPADTGSRISKLIAYLRSSRCLLVLDNGATILQSGTSCGCYREGY